MKNWYATSQQDLDLDISLDEGADFEDEGDEFEDEEVEDFEEDVIDSEPFESDCFHGSVIQPGEELFSEFSSQYSDYGAVWVALEEEVAKIFALRSGSDFTTGYIPVVFRCIINLDKCIQIYNKHCWDDIADRYGFSNSSLADAIPSLTGMGYDGWKTLGGISGRVYEDVASFYERKVNITGVKIMTPRGWSEFVDINTGDEMIEQLRNAVKNPIFSPEAP